MYETCYNGKGYTKIDYSKIEMEGKEARGKKTQVAVFFPLAVRINLCKRLLPVMDKETNQNLDQMTGMGDTLAGPG